MKHRIILGTLLISMCATSVSLAQTDDKIAVERVIIQLFDGMRAADTTMMAQVFTPNALLASIGRSNDPNVIVHTPATSFVQSIGRPRNDVYDERTAEMDIKVDGNMASAWVPYSFYIGDTFSHCGVNSIQLAKFEGSWKITYVIDTRRKENCIVD